MTGNLCGCRERERERERERYNLTKQKSNKGITLVTLIIIVAVVIIIASVAISTGISALNSTRLKGFYTQLEMVQKRVDEIASNDEYYIDNAGNEIYLAETGLEYGETGYPTETLTRIITAEGGSSLDSYIQDFRYFKKEQVKNILGIENIDYNLFINFEERIIIAEEGITIKDKTYYMLQSATYFVKHYSKTESEVDFSVSAKKLTDGYYKIIIEPKKDTNNFIVKYKEIFTKYWEKTNELEIKVADTLPKYFDIQYKDLSINKSITKSYGIYLDEEKNVQITLIKKIYTKENLLEIEKDAQTSETYTKTYILMNNISFEPSELVTENPIYTDYFQEINDEKISNYYYWKPIGEKTLENSAMFEGNEKEIHVTYTDSDNEKYTVTYNKENNYSEPEYEFNITTWLVDEEKNINNELTNFTDIYNVTEEGFQENIGTTVQVKRGPLNAIKVQAQPSIISYKPSEKKEIKAENPSKINKNVKLEITYRYVTVEFNIIGKEDGNEINLNEKATIEVKIDGTSCNYNKANGIKVIAGMNNISWNISAENYIENEGSKSATKIEDEIKDEIKDKITIKVILKKWVKLTIITPKNSTLNTSVSKGRYKESGTDENSNKYLIVEQGSTITYSLSKEHYYTKNGTIQMGEADKTETLELEPIMVTLTINATPAEATIEIKNTSGTIIKSGTGTVSASVLEGSIVKYSVSADGYVPELDKEIVMNDDETLEIKLKEIISKTTSYRGYYADVDADGTVDGIIYADLAFDRSGGWGIGDNGKYSYNKKDTLNNYYIISRDSCKMPSGWSDKWPDNDVILAVDTVEENDRFYVMSLNDFIINRCIRFYWYYNAYDKMSGYASTTSTDFGTGKQNTATMMTKVYGNGLKDRDLWKDIGSEVEKGWFIPSRGEWGAFGAFVSSNVVGVNTSNYSDYWLSMDYWSSSQRSKTDAWVAEFETWGMTSRSVNGLVFVRLSTTF